MLKTLIALCVRHLGVAAGAGEQPAARTESLPRTLVVEFCPDGTGSLRCETVQVPILCDGRPHVSELPLSASTSVMKDRLQVGYTVGSDSAVAVSVLAEFDRFESLTAKGIAEPLQVLRTHRWFRSTSLTGDAQAVWREGAFYASAELVH